MKNYSIKRTGVSHDVFDDEIVALNLADGKYYSMEGVAAVIWQAVKHNLSSEAIVQLLLTIPGTHHGSVDSALEQFLLQLEAEGLLAETDNSSLQAPNLPIPLPGSYEAPVLHIFTDMQEVIALDPVHDVSEKGWPLKNDGSEK